MSRHSFSNWIIVPRWNKLKKRRIFLPWLSRKRRKGWKLVLQFLLYIHLTERKIIPHHVGCALFTQRFSFNEGQNKTLKNLEPWQPVMQNSKVFGGHVTHEVRSSSLACISSIHSLTFYGHLVTDWQLGPSQNYYQLILEVAFCTVGCLKYGLNPLWHVNDDYKPNTQNSTYQIRGLNVL